MEKITESNPVLNVLCLEDVLKDTELLSEMLTGAGYQVSMDIAAGEKPYLSYLKSRKYNLILADYTLPGFNALAALKLALQLQPEVPFICVSGTIGEDTAVEMLKLGAADYVLKDRMGRLVFAVQRALEGVEQQKELNKAVIEKFKVIHSLEVHQIELELQNEELIQAKEQAVSASEKYIELYDFAPSGYFTLTGKGEILQLNLSGAKMLGKDRSKIKNRLFHLFVTDDSMPIFRLFLEKIFNSNAKETCEVALSLNGSLPMYVHITAIVAKNGDQCYVTVTDINSRKQAEEALKKSEERIKDLISTTDGIVWEADAQTFGFTYVSPQAERILGYKIEDWYSEDFWATHIYQDDRDDAIKFCAYMTNQCLSHNFEYRFISKNGKVVWLRDIVNVIVEDGKPLLIRGIMIDITERKQAESDLRTSNEFNQALLNTIPFGMNIVDESGNILYVSEGLKQHFGEGALSKKCWELYIDDKIQCVDCPLHAGIKIGLTQTYEAHGVLGGKIFEVSHTGMIFNGKKAMLEIFLDITERKHLEDNLLKSRTLLTETEKTGKIGGWTFNVETLAQTWTDEIFHILEIDTTNGAPMVPQGLEFIDEPYRQMAELAIQLAIEYGESYDQEWMVTTDNGNKRWVHSVGRVNQVLGKTISLSGSFQDITERKLVEAALLTTKEKAEESEANLKAALENSQAGIAIAEYPSGKLKYVNKAALLIWDKEYDEIVKDIDVDTYVSSWQILHFDGTPYQADEVPLARAIIYGETSSREFIVRRDNNEDRYVWANAAPIFNAKGIQTSAIVVFLDITDRKLAEFKLIEKDVQFRNLANSGSALIWTSGTDKLCNYFNESWMAFTGRTLEQELGNGWAEGVHPDDFDQCIATYVAAFDRHEPFEMEYRLRHASGEYRWILDLGTPNYNSTGEFIGYIGNCFDITERKQTEESLLMLKTAIEKSEVSVLITDYKGNIKYANPYFTELTGYTASEYIEQNPKILKSDFQTKEYYEELWDTISSGKTWEGEFYNRKKNGEYYWENAIISPIENDKNEITHFVAIKTDITQAKNTQSELLKAKEHAEESDQLKSAFLANMSHEIRTPLNSIIGFSDLLNDPDFDQEQKTQFTRSIIENGNNLMVIISDILDLSMIAAGQIKFRKDFFSIQKLLEDLDDDFKMKASGKGIDLRLSVQSDGQELIIENDNYRIKQILTNLIGNAIKFTSHGFVEFGYLIKGENIEFQVKDTGIGIAPEYFEAIFDRFRQVEITKTRRYGGNGLGLAISKNLAELLGGKIWVDSEVGKGSTFHLSIPIHSKSNENTVSPHKIETPVKEIQIRNLKILIAEDEDDSSKLISIGVRKYASEIINVQTGKEAVDACRNNPDIDLVLMDIQMPEMDGYEATMQIRKFNPDVVIIAQTAFALNGDKEKALEAGCTDYISKPICRDELMKMIQKYFSK